MNDRRRFVRLFLGAALAVLTVAFLFLIAFPWIDRMFVTNPVLQGG